MADETNELLSQVLEELRTLNRNLVGFGHSSGYPVYVTRKPYTRELRELGTIKDTNWNEV